MTADDDDDDDDDDDVNIKHSRVSQFDLQVSERDLGTERQTGRCSVNR